MSEAVEGAEVMCYCVSRLYKESANCRLEANYAFQNSIDMIPLMLEQGYKANGWLGLILGTRLWYAFFDEAVATDEAFTQQMDSLTREIGDRGKIAPTREPAVSEAIPPVPTPTPAPAPVPAPAPPLASTPTTPALAPGHPAPSAPPSQRPAFSNEHQQTQMAMVGATSTLGDLSLFIEKQQVRDEKTRLEINSMMQKHQAELKAQRAEMQAAMDAKIAELTPPPRKQAISPSQLVALQVRLEKLHASELLTDDELFACEDMIADWVELEASMHAGQTIDLQMLYAGSGRTFGAGVKLHKVIVCSESMTRDVALARQIQRKFM